MSDKADTIRPSGRRAIDEMREFAAELPERIGPFFGRDVVRMLDSMEAENQRLRQERDAFAERLSILTAQFNDAMPP